MKLAVLFWFYKDLEVCSNRLRILRNFNKNISIYGLYGGPIYEAENFNKKLSRYLDHFYVFEESKSSDWKWNYGDLMIAKWFAQVGKELKWDTIIVVQADMIIWGNIKKMFGELNKNELLLSSVRTLEEVRLWWSWLKPSQSSFSIFYNYLKERFGYNKIPICCQFVVVCFPRVFLEKFSKIPSPEVGFIEYRIPMFAQVFDVRIVSPSRFNCWWKEEPGSENIPTSKRTLTAAKDGIRYTTILLCLLKRKDPKIFHPYNKIFPIAAKDFLVVTKKAISYRLKRLAAI